MEQDTPKPERSPDVDATIHNIEDGHEKRNKKIGKEATERGAKARHPSSRSWRKEDPAELAKRLNLPENKAED